MLVEKESGYESWVWDENSAAVWLLPWKARIKGKRTLGWVFASRWRRNVRVPPPKGLWIWHSFGDEGGDGDGGALEADWSAIWVEVQSLLN